MSGSDDERSGYLPPHELRALVAQLGDRGGLGGVPDAPGPSVVPATPGLAGAAAAPTSAGMPAFGGDDPASFAIVLARMANELGVSAIPVPTPEATFGSGLAAPASPGTAPQLAATVPGAPSSPLDAISPQLLPQELPSAQPPPSPAIAGGPSGAASDAQTSNVLVTPGGVGLDHGALPSELRAPELAAWPASTSIPFPASATPPSTLAPPVGPSPSSAVPGRPSGFAMPPSNAASPGGAPGLPAHVLPSAPTLPFASHAEQAGSTALGRFGAVPPVSSAAIASPGTLTNTSARLPTAHELGDFAGAVPATSAPVATYTSAPVATYASAPSPNAGTTDVAAPPTPGPGRSPFEPTDLSAWTPAAPAGSIDHAAIGRLPLLGEHPLVIEPGLPAFALPLVDHDHVPLDTDLDARPHASPSPVFTGGESRAIRQVGGAPFDPYAVRKDFPILEERVQGGKRLVWLDNAATTQKPRAVIDRLTHYYEHENSNVHRAAHTLAARATDAFESGRESTRKFLNASSTSEIVFVRGATEGINLIANTWGAKHVGAGDEIVITHLEHHANIVPWQMLCARVGARLRVAPVDDRGDVILADYERLLGPRTKLVAFTQVSNALGTITPAREMIEIAHRHGACTLLDGAQAVSHMPVDVQQLGCDFYVFSGHKVFAPTGIGAVYGRKELLDDMPPWQGGGNMIADVTFERTIYQGPPWRFEAGTGNIADAAGLGAALDYVMRIGMTAIDRYEHDLLVYATERLVRIPGLTMIGTAVNKAGVLSFVLDGQRTEDVGTALDKEGIAVRSGHHCAQPILRRFGLEATVRASLAFYNVCEDIDALVDAVARLQTHRRSVPNPA